MSEGELKNTKSLSELVVINNGIDYKNNPKGHEDIPIYGTGGIMGYTSIALNEGPAVLSGRKGSINRPFYVEGKFWHVDTIFCLKPLDNINAKWLYYSLLNTDLTKLNEATGVPSVTSKSLYRLRINYFKPDKQREISEILTTCDTVIEKTQLAIAKYKSIKQGMLHDLFTRGLDAKGRLRPGYEEAPELYKESELGWIPKEWEVNTLGSIFSVSSGNGLVQEDIQHGSFPVYGGNGIIAYHNQYISENKKLIIGRVGEYCGNVFITEPFSWITDNALIISFKNCDITIEFWYYYLNYLNLNRFAYSAAQPVITGKQLSKVFTIIIGNDEQMKISKRLLIFENKLKSEEDLLNKYQSIKRGLMGDLLGGCLNQDLQD